MSAFTKHFGKRLKSLRTMQNITQEKFAEKIGINLRQLARVEAGESFIRAVTLENICKVLNIYPSELFDFKFEGISKKDSKIECCCPKYEILINKFQEINMDEKKVEYMILAFDSLFSNKSLAELKNVIKGMELR